MGGVGPSLDGPAARLRQPGRLSPVRASHRDGLRRPSPSGTGAASTRRHQSFDERVGRTWATRASRPKRGACGPVVDQAIRQSGLGLFVLDRLDLGGDWGGVMAGLRWDRDDERSRRQPEGRRSGPLGRLCEHEKATGSRRPHLEPKEGLPADSTPTRGRVSFLRRRRSSPTIRRPSADSTRRSSRPHRMASSSAPAERAARGHLRPRAVPPEHGKRLRPLPHRGRPLETFYYNPGATRR